MENNWWYVLNNKKCGPVSGEAIRKMLDKREIPFFTLVSQQGTDRWTPAIDVREFNSSHSVSTPEEKKGNSSKPKQSTPAMASKAKSPPAAASAKNETHKQTANSSTDEIALCYAGFWRRLVAYLIDLAILYAVMLPLAVLAGILAAEMNNMDTYQLKRFESALTLIFFATAWLYFAFMESSAQKGTYGKRLIGLQVTNLQGQPVSFNQATGRFFARVLSALPLGLGFLMAAFTARKQTIHDIVAKTLVLRTQPNRSSHWTPIRNLISRLRGRPNFYGDARKEQIELYQYFFDKVIGSVDVSNNTAWAQGDKDYDRNKLKEDDSKMEQIILGEATKRGLSATYLQVMVHQYFFADPWMREMDRDCWVRRVLKRSNPDYFPDAWAVKRLLEAVST